MRNSDPVWTYVDERRERYDAMADRIWDKPEIAYDEFASVEEHAAMLAAESFRITRNVVGIPTAVIGEAGEGGPVIAILGEYDALPGLSQEAGIAEPSPLPGNGLGHGCGHNLLGTGALLAAAAVKDWLAANGIKGRVRYYGCPAEEDCGSKGYMVRDGAFDDVDIAISWHPHSLPGVSHACSLANTRIDFTFEGRASHAAASPHLGRSALDAIELMNIGVNYMREHMPSSARIHYAYLDAGGIAPNVVQAKATVSHLIRADDLRTLPGLAERVKKIAEGAALMTETKVAARVFSAEANLLGNKPLEQAMQDAMERLGPPDFDDADRKYAEEIRATLSAEDIAVPWKQLGLKDTGIALADFIVPLGSVGEFSPGSTDVADVSWKVPTVQAHGATCAVGTPFHSWQLTAQGKSPAAHKGMAHVAKVMASTAIAAFTDETLIPRAKAEHRERTGGMEYRSPMPAEMKPPLRPARAT